MHKMPGLFGLLDMKELKRKSIETLISGASNTGSVAFSKIFPRLNHLFLRSLLTRAILMHGTFQNLGEKTLISNKIFPRLMHSFLRSLRTYAILIHRTFQNLRKKSFILARYMKAELKVDSDQNLSFKWFS